MTSKDTLLRYVLQFAETQNKICDAKISQLQALKIYHEMIRGNKKAGN